MKRLDYLDMTKGLAIILVAIGHIYCTNPITKWIYSFHMPLFFFICGCLAYYKRDKDNSKSFKELIIARLYTLILPYCIFSGLNIAISYIIFKYSFKHLIWDIIPTVTFAGVGAVWFLPVLFIAEILFIMLNRYVNNKYLRIFTIIVLTIVPFVVSGKDISVVTLVFARSFIGLCFIFIGYYMFKFINNVNVHWIVVLLMLSLTIPLSKINGDPSIWNLTFNNIFLYFLSAILGSLTIILLFKKLPYNKHLSYLGVNSLPIMALHQNIIAVINKVIPGWPYGSYITGLIVLLIALSINLIFAYVINKHFKWILGKFDKREKQQIGAVLN